MPDFIPPHKNEYGAASAEDRLEMCRIAFRNIPRTEISDFEIIRRGTSYTYLTLEVFSSDDVDLYFLCGTDMFLSIDTWKCPKRIFELATICYVRREDDCDNDYLIDEKIKFYIDNFSARIIKINHAPYVASSTDLRESIAKRSGLSDEIHEEVYKYIKKRGLYQ